MTQRWGTGGRRLAAGAAALLALAAAGGCSGTSGPAPSKSVPASQTSKAPAPMTLTSSAFSDNGVIPAAYTCDAASGAAVSPPLRWSAPPAGTAWLALYAYDNTGAVIHWIVVNLKPGVTALASGSAGGGVEVANYLPMCPGVGNTDQYQFTVYAEPAGYHLPKIGASYAVDPSALAAHALGIGTLHGIYSQ